MRPLPTSFHVGPLLFHTYGLGLAVAGLVAYAYANARLPRRQISAEPLGRWSLATLGASLVGARLFSVLSNWSLYRSSPTRVIALWQGGLSSFGALLCAIPVGLWLMRRWWPGLSRKCFADALVPVLLAAWALGRVLGPQLMVAGGGHPTSAWFGMYYDGQVGRRVPVPLIQAAEDAVTWLLALAASRRWADRRPGVVTGGSMILWGLARGLDEHWLLGGSRNLGSTLTQLASALLVAGGVVLLATTRERSTPRQSDGQSVSAA